MNSSECLKFARLTDAVGQGVPKVKRGTQL